MHRAGVVLVSVCVLGAGAWSSPTRLIPAGASWRYWTLSAPSAPPGWHEPEFDDRGWTSGIAGFSAGKAGYDQAATVIPSSVEEQPVVSLLLRHEFTFEDAAGLAGLYLRLEYEDGVIGWLNGEEVFRRGVIGPGPGVTNVVASVHPAGEAELIDLTPFRQQLVRGTNLLALQVIDAGIGVPSLFVWPELRGNFGRGPFVQRVLQDEATILWQDPAGHSSWVEWAERDIPGSGGFERAGTLSEGVFRLKGLRSGTTYRYRVGLGEPGVVSWSDWAEFTTLRASGDIDFVVVGDTGGGLAATHAIAHRIEEESPDLVLHTGDLVYPAFTPGRMDLRCFSPFEGVLRRFPFFTTFGNHDIYQFDRPYLDAFTLPTNAVTGTEHYYSFNHGDAHFVCLFLPWWGLAPMSLLGADGQPTDAYRWLTNDLAATDRRWKIVFFHQPPKTSGPHLLDDYNADGRPDVLQLQETLLPVFREHGVRVVFNGHDHFWERFAPTNGVHLVVTGGGGAVLYEGWHRDPASAQLLTRHHIVRVRLRGDELGLTAVDPDGEILDRMTIRQAAPSNEVLMATWHSPEPAPGDPTNSDGNHPGQRFDFVGADVAGVAGWVTNPGRLGVNEDALTIHVGLRDVMLWPGQTLALFIASPTTDGVSATSGVGRLRGHPLADLALEFEGFSPAFVCLLGDEQTDRTIADFVGAGTSTRLGQGVFRLDPELTPQATAGVEQFNRSPETAPDPAEQNADFIIVSLPRAMLGGVQPGDRLRVGAVVLTPSGGDERPRLELDSAYVGRGLRPGAEAGSAILRPLEVILPGPPADDEDLDGLATSEEQSWSTDPKNPDSDHDGLPDGWEVRHALNPTRPLGVDGASGDPDGDRHTNLEEFRSNTDPRDGSPTLRLRVGLDEGVLMLQWRATIGRVYDVEVANALPGRFTSAGFEGFPRIAKGTNEGTVLRLPEPAEGGQWFRVRELP